MTSARSAMPGLLPLRATDAREVGGYELVGRLGEGGQGVVYLALSSAGTKVAIKVLPATSDPQVRSRFLKEVAAAQRVARFCTAQVLDAGIFERRPFIVSEYVNGPSLIEIVEQDGPRGSSALQRLAVATLTALGAVHAAGMVHRDFKPANVLLGPDGPVVIDFGVASVPGMTTGLSGQSQMAVGTPAYMAPEQLAGSRVTAAADMWSWAVSMTFAGTGRLPFTGDSLTAMGFAILNGDPSVEGLPEPLGSIVRRCLSKDPAVRPSAREALSELVAAGAQPLGPLPSQAAPLVVDDEASALPTVPVEAPGPSRHVASAGPGRGEETDKAARARGGGGNGGRVRWRWWAAALLAVVLLGGGGGGLTLLLSRNSPPAGRQAEGRAGGSPELAAEAAARAQAVTWILQQVSRAVVVSCDNQVCADLAQGGFPAPDLETIGPGTYDPLGSTLIVATAAVRAQFGSRLASVYAPALIASFGSGNAEIEIRELYGDGGAPAFRADVRTALQARKTSDAELLRNRNIAVSATARAQLFSGNIDPRLPTLIAPLADTYPVHIVDFGDPSPGGGPASPLRSVDLATFVAAAHLSAPAYLSWMQGLVNDQRTEYRPASCHLVTLPNGQTVLRITFDAPSPLN